MDGEGPVVGQFTARYLGKEVSGIDLQRDASFQ